MEHVDLNRCGRRGSDVLHSMGVVEYYVRSACCGCSLLHACAYAEPLSH